MATSDAPVYFAGPVDIGGDCYVDGGVGGNCPLKQVGWIIIVEDNSN